jgi:hypothetical protein
LRLGWDEMSTAHDLAWWRERLDAADAPDMYVCPVHGGGSLHVEDKAGKVLVKCFGCDAKYDEVLAALETGEDPAPSLLKSAAPKREVSRTGYEVRDERGALYAVHTRVEYDDGTKTYLWPKGIKAAQAPLYGSQDLAGYDRSQPLLVVEGERCRDRAVQAGYQAVGLSGGASIEPPADVLKVLTGWRLILWPDNDDPGRKVMAYVATMCAATAVEVRAVTWPDAPPKGDVADYLDGHTSDDMDALLNDAEAYPTEPDGWGNGKGVDALDILTRDYPDPVFVVPGVLPEGTAILASNPKIGKSAMCYQITAEVAMGGAFIGVDLKRRPVLFYALEDSERRSKGRLLTALQKRQPKRGMIEMRWAAPQLGKGLEQEIAVWLDAHPTGLVIVDTFQKVRPPSRSGANAYETDVAAFSLIQDLVRHRPGATVLLVLHLKKGPDTDFLSKVSGSHGGPGTTDTTLVLNRPRHAPAGTLEVTGRDVGEVEIAVTYDNTLWSRDVDRVPGASPERQYVYDLIKELQPVWPSQVADAINDRGGETTRPAVSNLITKLVAAKWVEWTTAGYKATGHITLKSTAGANAGGRLPGVLRCLSHEGGVSRCLSQAHRDTGDIGDTRDTSVIGDTARGIIVTPRSSTRGRYPGQYSCAL